MAFMGHDEMTNLSADLRADSRGFLDGSGWTVSTGGSKATGATQTRTADAFGGSPVMSASLGGVGGGLGLSSNTLMLMGGAVLLIVLLKRRKG